MRAARVFLPWDTAEPIAGCTTPSFTTSLHRASKTHHDAFPAARNVSIKSRADQIAWRMSRLRYGTSDGRGEPIMVHSGQPEAM